MVGREASSSCCRDKASVARFSMAILYEVVIPKRLGEPLLLL